jgi:hypothetical protein
VSPSVAWSLRRSVASPVVFMPPVRGGGLKVVRGYHYAAGEHDGDKGRAYFEARYGRGPQCGDACPIRAAAAAIRLAGEERAEKRAR